MNENKILLDRFYTALANRDFEEMISCYHENVVFRDPAFGKLNAREAKAMWKMLLSGAGIDFNISYEIIDTGQYECRVNWRAEYLFGKKRKKVINRVNAHFLIAEGLITHHTDEFDLWKWSRQALGIQGVLLAWAPFFQKSLRKTFRLTLHKFMANQ